MSCPRARQRGDVEAGRRSSRRAFARDDASPRSMFHSTTRELCRGSGRHRRIVRPACFRCSLQPCRGSCRRRPTPTGRSPPPDRLPASRSRRAAFVSSLSFASARSHFSSRSRGEDPPSDREALPAAARSSAFRRVDVAARGAALSPAAAESLSSMPGAKIPSTSSSKFPPPSHPSPSKREA